MTTARRSPYYSVRTRKNPLAAGFDLGTLRDVFKTQFIYFGDKGCFQEALGYHCVDQGFVPGSLGHNMEGAFASGRAEAQRRFTLRCGS
jgi:hypothetical protein